MMARTRPSDQGAGTGANLVFLPVAEASGPLVQHVAVAFMRARHIAGLCLEQFAVAIGDILGGRAVGPEQVARWERGEGCPSAEELLAAAQVAGVEVEILFGRRSVVDRLADLEQIVARQGCVLRRLR